MTDELPKADLDEVPGYQPALLPGSGRVIVLTVFVGALLYVTASALLQSYSGGFFLVIPFVLGFLPGVLAPQRPYLATFCVLLLSLALSILTLREGVVCVLLALPLFVPAAFLGTLGGVGTRRFLKTRRMRRDAGLLCVGLALAWQAIEGAHDDPKRHPLHRVAGSVAIDAPRDEVFAALTVRPPMLRRSWPWFIELGLPISERLEVIEPRLGGEVRWTHDRGVAYGRVLEWAPPHRFAFTVDRYVTDDLPFHITRLGRTPDYGLKTERVEDWLSVHAVRFEVEALANGRTRLSHRMEWRRHLAPAAYFGWVQQAVMDRWQERLLQLLRESIEERHVRAVAGEALTRR